MYAHNALILDLLQLCFICMFYPVQTTCSRWLLTPFSHHLVQGLCLQQKHKTPCSTPSLFRFYPHLAVINTDSSSSLLHHCSHLNAIKQGFCIWVLRQQMALHSVQHPQLPSPHPQQLLENAFLFACFPFFICLFVGFGLLVVFCFFF